MGFYTFKGQKASNFSFRNFCYFYPIKLLLEEISPNLYAFWIFLNFIINSEYKVSKKVNVY